jgi:hypothetical protein
VLVALVEQVERVVAYLATLLGVHYLPLHPLLASLTMLFYLDFHL